jgi:hypothetical protein
MKNTLKQVDFKEDSISNKIEWGVINWPRLNKLQILFLGFLCKNSLTFRRICLKATKLEILPYPGYCGPKAKIVIP